MAATRARCSSVNFGVDGATVGVALAAVPFVWLDAGTDGTWLLGDTAATGGRGLLGGGTPEHPADGTAATGGRGLLDRGTPEHPSDGTAVTGGTGLLDGGTPEHPAGGNTATVGTGLLGWGTPEHPAGGTGTMAS